MTLASRGGPLALFVATGLFVHLASTHDAAAQSAEAEALFRDGRTLIKKGKLEPGCDKLEASERLESSVGTLLNLGDCREKQGRTASAWAAFRKAEATAKRAGDDAKRMKEAQRRADKLEARLVRLVIQVDHPVDGLVIKRDAEPVDTAVWGTPVPVDPDRYKIVAEAPGYLAWRTEVNVDGKVKRRVVQVPALQRAPAPPPTPVATGPAIQSTQPSPRAPEQALPGPRSAPPPTIVESPRTVAYVAPRSTWTGTRKFSAALALAGIGAAGVGVYYGLEARDLSKQSDALCPLVVCTDPRGLRLNDQAQDAALRANILYAAGGGAVALAAVLWVVGAPGEHTLITPNVGSGQAGVSFSGSF